MSPISGTVVSNASNAQAGSVQGAVAVQMLKKSMDQQQSSAAQLLQALPQPALARSGSLGTQVNTYA